MSGEFAAGLITGATVIIIAGLVWAAIADGIAMYQLITQKWKP